MENKKFETLIDLIINENEDKARELFHEIVVEKSREIYESIMDEEMHDTMDEGDSVGGMLDEIEAEEQMSEDDDAEVDFDHDAEEAGDELTHDIEGEHDEAAEEDKMEDLEDRVVDVENELDELMAKFEEIMGGEGSEDMGNEEGSEDMGDEDMMEAAEDDEEDVTEAKEEDDEEAVEEAIAEAVQLQKVSVTHGDNGSNPKSIALHEPKVKTAGVKPVKFSGDSETVPTGPKGPSNEYSKKEGELPGAGKFKNVPGQKGQELGKAPAPVKSQASGVNTKSPVSKG